MKSNNVYLIELSVKDIDEWFKWGYSLTYRKNMKALVEDLLTKYTSCESPAVSVLGEENFMSCWLVMNELSTETLEDMKDILTEHLSFRFDWDISQVKIVEATSINSNVKTETTRFSISN